MSEEEGSAPSRRGVGNRTLTQKYDMSAVRAIQTIEEKLIASLATVYGCDADELPVEIDSLEIFHASEPERIDLVTAILKDAPGDVSEAVNSFLDGLKELDSKGVKPVLK